MLNRVRTSHFPTVFLFLGLMFCALFGVFYLFVFQSISGILIQQNLRIISGLTAGISESERRLDEQAKILRVSRKIQRQLQDYTSLSEPPKDNTKLREFVSLWRRQVDNNVYRAVTYLDSNKIPITAVDFLRVPENRSVDESGIASVSVGDGSDFVVKHSSEALLNSWHSSTGFVLGNVSLAFDDSTRILRTLYEITGRRSGECIGYLGIDRVLDQVIPWKREPDRNLIIYHSVTGRIVFDGERFGRADKADRRLIRAVKSGDVEDGVVATEYSYDGENILVTAIQVPELKWTVATLVYLKPLLKEAELRGSVLVIASICFVVLTGLLINGLTARVRRRTDELEKANQIVTAHTEMLEEELQTAHDMQMRLMPQEHPDVNGFDIVGVCRPATQVGGDFFQYFSLPDSRLAIALADVTGHGMEAAIPTMVFSGLLDNQIEYTPSPDELMARLNTSLYRVLDRRTFICFSIGELDPYSRRFRLSNGGCPYPYLYRATTGEVEEVNLSAFPLGMRPGSTYGTVELVLEEGDMVVFCSDGIIEASNSGGELYGFDRTSECIRQAGLGGVAARTLIQSLFERVDKFVGGGHQEDDQTIVAVRAVGFS